MERGACISCGSPLRGSYCHACGERDPRERDDTLRGFLREQAAAFTDMTARGPSSVRLLLTRPGELTREYMLGRRVRYLHPLQLFLLANVSFFLLLSVTGVIGLSTPLRSQLYDQVYSDWVRDAIRERNLQAEDPDFATFEARFDLAAEIQAKSLVIILVPLFAALVLLSRAWKREPLVHHLVFATHFAAFVLFLFVAMGLLIRTLLWLPGGARFVTEQTATLTVIAGCAAYLYPALRRTYGDARIPALARAAALALGFMALVVLYRFILFFTVLYSV